MRFLRRDFFGTEIRQSGPMPKMRNLRETLPGVKGYRVYDLAGFGPDTVTMTFTGRLKGVSPLDLQRAIETGLSYLGKIGLLETELGMTYRNAELIDYRPVSPYAKMIYRNQYWYTVLIQATFEAQ